MLPGTGHDVVALDVADEAAWNRAADRIAPDGHLDGIVAAAALLPPIGPLGSWSIDAFRSTLDVNIVGTLLPVVTFVDALRSVKGSVVLLSGGGATAPFPRFTAYATSKAAVVRMAENLAHELAPDGVRVNAIAPGFVVSPMHDETLRAGPGLVGAEYFERTRKAVESKSGDSPELAARLSAFLLSRASHGISGKLLSARWDPWENEAFRARLRTDPDLGTLRRIDDQFFGAISTP
jgi:3-oxoacyl-[acyl-carrier protein] reductase